MCRAKVAATKIDQYLGEGWGKDYLVGGVASIAGSKKRKRTREEIAAIQETLKGLHAKKAVGESPEQKASFDSQIAREQGKIEALRKTLASQNKAF